MEGMHIVTSLNAWDSRQPRLKHRTQVIHESKFLFLATYPLWIIHYWSSKDGENKSFILQKEGKHDPEYEFYFECAQLKNLEDNNFYTCWQLKAWIYYNLQIERIFLSEMDKATFSFIIASSFFNCMWQAISRVACLCLCKYLLRA